MEAYFGTEYCAFSLPQYTAGLLPSHYRSIIAKIDIYAIMSEHTILNH